MSNNKAFEEWARLSILNLNLETYPAMHGQIGGGQTYRDPTTEIARAAWFAGIAEAKAEVAGLRKHAKAMTEALRKVRPLGGSELFMRVGEVFYADPIYCGNEIDRLRGELDKLRRAALSAPQREQGR